MYKCVRKRQEGIKHSYSESLACCNKLSCICACVYVSVHACVCMCVRMSKEVRSHEGILSCSDSLEETTVHVYSLLNVLDNV